MGDAIHPGEYLRDELVERDMTQTMLAAAMGRPYQAICEIVNGKKRVTARTARQLGEVLGTSADLWLNLQNAYDLAISEPAS